MKLSVTTLWPMPLTRMKVQALVLVVMKLSEDKKAKKRKRNHCVKSDRIRKFSGPYFPAFGLNTEGYFISPLFSPNAGKYGPEKLQIQILFTQ